MGTTFNPFTGNFDFKGSGGSGTPGGSDTNIQFNDGGVFGGAKIDYTESSTDLTLQVENAVNNDDARNLQVNGANGDSSKGGALRFNSGGPGLEGKGGEIYFESACGVNNDGGDIHFVVAGVNSGTGDSGSFIVEGGQGSDNGDGSAVTITSGVGGETAGGGGTFTLTGGIGATAGPGGSFYLSGGAGGKNAQDPSYVGNGGQINLTGGQGTGTGSKGGTVYLNGGSGQYNSSGGNVEIVPGLKNGTGTDGILKITDPTSSISAVIDTTDLITSDKTFTFPNKTGTFALLDDTGSSVTGILKSNGTTISAASSGTDYLAPGGALGTPASGTLTNCTGLPAASVVAGSLAANMEASDHGTAATDMLVNVAYGTGAAPSANTTTEGSLYITYTA